MKVLFTKRTKNLILADEEKNIFELDGDSFCDNYKNRIPSFCVERSEGGTLYEGYSYDEKNIKDTYEVISTRNHLRYDADSWLSEYLNDTFTYNP